MNKYYGVFGYFGESACFFFGRYDDGWWGLGWFFGVELHFHRRQYRRRHHNYRLHFHPPRLLLWGVVADWCHVASVVKFVNTSSPPPRPPCGRNSIDSSSNNNKFRRQRRHPDSTIPINDIYSYPPPFE